jgi:hypothetical protein
MLDGKLTKKRTRVVGRHRAGVGDLAHHVDTWRKTPGGEPPPGYPFSS